MLLTSPLRLLSTSCGAVKSFLESPPELHRLSAKFPLGNPLAEKLNKVIDLSQEAYQLRLRRLEMLSLPAHSVQGRNKELLSLGVAAVSGGLSLSIHPGFAIILLFSYRMYRSANAPTRERLRGADSAKQLQLQIADIHKRLDSLLEDLRRERG